MRKIRLLSIVLVVLLVAVVFGGCGESKASDETNSSGNFSNNSSDINSDVQAGETVLYDKLPSKLTAEKIGTITESVVIHGNTGLVFKKDGKYGIASLDGSKKTDAKYAHCEAEGDYFIVATNMPTDSTEVTSLNYIGLADSNGNVLIPEQYATIDVISNKYAKVCEVTEVTDNKDEALIYLKNSIFQIGPDDNDTYYKGNWYVYDLTTGKKVPGATGTSGYQIYNFGELLQYYDDSEQKHTVNSEGKALPDGAKYFDNGCYMVDEGDQSVIYNSDGSKVFTCETDGFVPFYGYDDYYVARKYDNVTKYVIMDPKGKIISAEFESTPNVYGKLIFVGGKLVDFQGNVVVEDSYDQVYFEKQIGNAWCLVKDQAMVTEEMTIVKEDGTVICKGTTGNSEVYVDKYDSFNVTNNEEGTCYCFATKDFSIESYKDLGPWMVVSPNSSGSYDVVDTLSGQSIISGYSSNYYCTAVEGSVMYVYAPISSGGYHIYSVK